MAIVWKQLATENLGTLAFGNMPAYTLIGRTTALDGNAEAVTKTSLYTSFGVAGWVSTDDVNLATYDGTSFALTTLGTINSASTLNPTNTVEVGYCGLGLTSVTANSILIGTGTSAPFALAAGDNTVLISAGASTVPTFRKLSLTADIGTLILPTDRGGTGLSTVGSSAGIVMRNPGNTALEVVTYVNLFNRLGLSASETYHEANSEVATHDTLFQRLDGTTSRTGTLDANGKVFTNFGLKPFATDAAIQADAPAAEGAFAVSLGSSSLWVSLNTN